MINTPRPDGPQARLVRPRNPTAITLEGRGLWADLGARLIVEYAETADMDDGQPLPPLIVDGAVWCIVRRLPDARTHWRRILLSAETTTTSEQGTDRRLVAPTLPARRQSRHEKP